MIDLTPPDHDFGDVVLPIKSFGGMKRHVPPALEGRNHGHAWRLDVDDVVRQLRVIIDETGPVKVHSSPQLPPSITSPKEMRRWTEWMGGDIALVVKRGRALAVYYGHHAPIGSATEVAGHPVPEVLGVPSAGVNGSLHQRLREALADPRWQFRTIEGLAASLGVPPKDIRTALFELGDAVRRPLASDASGRQLYTLATRRPTLRERYMQLRERLATW